MIAEYYQWYPFFRLLIPLVAGILCGDAFPQVVPVWGLGLACLLLFAGLSVCHCLCFRRLYGVLLFLLLSVVGYMGMDRQMRRSDFPFSNLSSTYRIVVRGKPETKGRSVLCQGGLLEEVRQDTVLAFSRPPLFLFYFPKDSMATCLKLGDELLIHTRLAPPVNNGNPYEFDYVRYLRHQGVAGTAYVAAGHWRVTGHDVARTFRQEALEYREKVLSLYRDLGFKGDELAVLSALTVGDKAALGDDIRETYSVAGASHVLALSGLHIGFIYALLFFLFTPLWRRWRVLKPMLLLLIVLFLWGFAFFTGLSASVVRSVIMFSLCAFAGLQSEKVWSMNTLLSAAFLMLLYNPVWLYDVGFQLSFVAVAAILIIQPRLYALWKVKNRFLRYGWGLVTVSVAAQVGTAPLVLFYFSRFSTHFLLTNLVAIPMVSLILYAAVLLLLLTPFSFLQGAFAAVVKALVSAQNAMLRWIEHLPLSSMDGIWIDGWEVLLYFLFLGLLCCAVMRRIYRNVFLTLFALLLLVSYHSVSAMLHAPQRSIVFYNVRGCPVVHCLSESGKSWLACADSLPDRTRLTRTLSPYWNRLQLEVPQWVADGYAVPGLSMQDGIVCYAGKRICLLCDGRWQGKESVSPASIDYLYVSHGYRGGMAELVSLFSIGTVVLDASLSDYCRHQIVDDCIRMGIPYLSLSQKGSVRILL